MDIKDFVKELTVLEIKPGQALCITLSAQVPHDMLKKMHDSIKDMLNCEVLILGPGTELSVVDVKDEDTSN